MPLPTEVVNMERRAPLPSAASGNRAKPKRYLGKVRVYLRDQGVGYIQLKEREFRFGVTDFIGDEQPVEGDVVSFVPQLLSDQYRARHIRIERRAADRLDTPAERLAREVRPESAETVRAAKTRAPVHVANPKARDHVRCGSCSRLVIPKVVRVKSRLFGGQARWVESCPRCKGSLDGKTSSLRMLWGATAAMVGGAVVVTRSFFF